MLAIRIKFKKEGRAKYISHLDVIRCMNRAIRRAKIPVYETQGFNPRPYIVFALPLPIFFESDCEFMDIKLNEDMELGEVKTRLNKNLPEGIEVLDVFLPEMKLKNVHTAKYEISLEYDEKSADELKAMIEKLLENETLSIEKRSKKGPIQFDTKEYFKMCEFEYLDGVIKIHAKLPAGSSLNISPALLITAISQYAAVPDMEYVRRTAVYNEENKDFR